MDIQALELLKSLHQKLEAQEQLRAEEKAEVERLRAEEKAEAERLRAEEKAEAERLRAEEKAEIEQLLFDTFVSQEQRLLAKLEAQEQLRIESEQRLISKLEENHREVKDQLTRIENHVLVIRGKVIPIDLDGITPQTKEDLQEKCTEAYDEYVNAPNEFDPRLHTKYDPRPDIVPTVVSKKPISKMKADFDLFRIGVVMDKENQTHGKKVMFGDFISKVTKVMFNYDFKGLYPISTLDMLNAFEKYFFTERAKSNLAEIGNGRMT